MAFELKKLFEDVFNPRKGEIVTILYDVPHDHIKDNKEWSERRKMAEEWQRQLEKFASLYEIIIKPLVTYKATGAHNADMPEYGVCSGKTVRLEDTIKDSTIIISMPEFSASAPLIGFTKKYKNFRVASMPMVTKSMEETGLSADYKKISETCSRLAPLFEKSDGIEVTFSTGHTCYFDTSGNNPVYQDNGILHPSAGKDAFRLRNLPSGEVFTCPNESEDSKTTSEIPAVFESETIVFILKNNKIIDVKGHGPVAYKNRNIFKNEPALCNIAEVAIGCNDKAVVSGNVLEDEKAGFHWAFGRSDHIGGNVGVKNFSSPDKVQHQDIVYAKGNPIICKKLDFIFPDGTKETAIVDGSLII